MQIQSLSPEQLQLTLRLSDLLSMQDLTVAAAVLCSFDWNIENAIKQLQNSNIQSQESVPIIHKEIEIQHKNDDQNQELYNYDIQENEDNIYQEDSNILYQNNLIDQKKKYFQQEHASLFSLKKTLSEPANQISRLQYHKQIANNSTAHRQQYLLTLINKSQMICKRIIESNSQNEKKYKQNNKKVQNNRKFINNLYKIYQPKINFTFGTLFLNLTRSYLQKKYLLVYIHSISGEIEENFKKIIQFVLQQKKIANIINKNCIAYGMFDNSDDYQIIQKYIPLKDLPALALFRLNKTKKAQQFISSYSLSNKEILLKWLSNSIGVQLSVNQNQGSHIQYEKKLKQEFQKKQIQKKKALQLEYENQIRQNQYMNYLSQKEQQDYLYAQMQKTYLQKRQLSKEEKDKILQNEQNLQKRRQEAIKKIEPQSSDSVIEIKFRMPMTGQTKIRRFNFTDKIQACFDFVDCFCRDQFQQKFCDFDIMQTHPTLNLSNFKQKTLEQIFEGSRRQNVIVRQKS